MSSRLDTRVTVKEMVVVTLSSEEVTHALKCWLSNVLYDSRQVPKVLSFQDVEVAVAGKTDGGALPAVTISYQPGPYKPTTAPGVENENDD